MRDFVFWTCMGVLLVVGILQLAYGICGIVSYLI